MRSFVSVALIGLTLAGTSAVAAAQSNAQPQAGRAGVRAEGRARFDSTRTARGDSGRGFGRREAMGARGALRGIKLSDAQKSSLKDIHKKYGEQLKTLREQNKGKAAAQNADTRAQFQAITARERDDIRAVLTPDQRTQFDANVAKMRDRAAKAGKGHTGKF
jgi:Spy/CpxP family protein refolding chaperone